MKVKDIITLVKAGYTPQEIGALGNDSSKVIEMISGGISKDDVPTLLEIANTVEAVLEDNKPNEDDKETPDDDSGIDYKAEYEKLLKEKQKRTSHEEINNNEKTADEILADMARSFM